MDVIVVLDFGGQYCHLIARRIRNFGVGTRIVPANFKKTDLRKIPNLKGIIFSGGAASVYDPHSPRCNKDILKVGVPILGICYGHQLIAILENGKVQLGKAGEYGVTALKILKPGKLLAGLNKNEKVWMNHKDIVTRLPRNYSVLATTDYSSIAVFENSRKKIYGVQFHPEVTHTASGEAIFRNFIFKICHAKKSTWGTSALIEEIRKDIRQKIGAKKAIIGLSGGVDSSTAAILVSDVIGKNLTAVYVDTGLMRYNEKKFIKREFSQYNFNLKIVNARSRFFNALKNVENPEKKRKIIGKLFVDIFEEIAQQKRAKILIQGTIYSDRIESGVTKNSSRIKSHHNVGGLPKGMKLELYEPLRDLYKDEVRDIAKRVGLSEAIRTRHVFPGPGFAIRIVGKVTPKKVEIVRQASHIIEEELRFANLYDKVWMAFAVLLPIKSVGIQGDSRSYKYPLVVRVVESKDAMTANFARIPYGILEKLSTRITNEIGSVNRVVYDISNKPPSTMEWE